MNKNDRPGDIDILIYSSDFMFSIAMECKKIKVQTKANGETKLFLKILKKISLKG